MPGADAHLRSLFTARQHSVDPDHALAARHAPILRFDAREPFWPLVVGYTVFRESAPSPSFPRRVDLIQEGQPEAAMAIEYAIWWDWDIIHLYELEHVWVFFDAAERVVRGEASWHGDYNDVTVNGSLPQTEGRLTLYSEPGKHAFAPVADWLHARAERTRRLCRQKAGVGGVLVKPLFEGLITCKSPRSDSLVRAYLKRHAFEPSFDFSRFFPIPAEALVPWSALYSWIPGRVAWLVDMLERIIPH